MSREPFPAAEPDGQEPGGSGPLPGGLEGAPWPEDDWDPDASIESLVAAIEAGEYELEPEAPEAGPGTVAGPGPARGAEQGLFVCLPPGQLTLDGFAQHGTADTMAPGALLAAVVDAVTGDDGKGLAKLSEDQLMGIISAARRLECRAAWTQLAAIAEFAARRPAPGNASGVSEFAADELAAELHLPWLAAAGQVTYACTVANRLPRAFAALGAGQLHPVHLRIIEDETSVLSDEDAARADEMLAGTAGSKTFAQLRYAARRLVLKLDPDAARKRKEAAKKQAHVRRFREDSGNAGMVARELPSDEVLASWQHVEQRALDLRAAGVPGTLRELRVRAYLDLLQERDSRTTPGGPPEGDHATRGGPPERDHATPGGPPERDHATPGGPPERDHGTPGDPGGHAGRDPAGPADPGADRPAPQPSGQADPGPSLGALVTITVPLDTVQGRSAAPGEAAGFGLLDADDARDLVAAAARHPATRWCLTALHPDGTAAAHACVPGRHPFTPARPGSRAGPDPPPAPSTQPGTVLPIQPDAILPILRARLLAIARGQCDHRHAETGYRLSRKLAHLITARSATCTAPGCGRPAARCDLDHTLAWQDGGLTCECNVAPLCRHHHRCKQSAGWRLEQPEPGVLAWQTPAGRAYATGPTRYPR